MALAGRGFGKTRTLSEEGAYAGLWQPPMKSEADQFRIGVSAPTFADLRKITFEGNSGLLAVIPESLLWKGSRNKAYNRNNQELRLWNGAIFSGYSAEEPDRLRGSQFHLFTAEEVASYKHEEMLDQIQMCLRLGKNPRLMIATTPKPTVTIKRLVKESEDDPEDTVIIRGSTFENTALGAKFFKRLRARYQGTRLGRQELFAELLTDTPGALWTLDMIERSRMGMKYDKATDRLVPPALPDFVRVVVAIDPMAGEPDPEDRPGVGPESGIVVAARGTDGHAYVLEDCSMSGRPHEWAKVAVAAYKARKADLIIGEVNNGGLMVMETVTTVDNRVNYASVHASRGKITRAEPISSLYERGMVHHVGTFAALESQMTTYIPGAKSPDRMDALVWALTDLMVDETDVPTAMVDEVGTSNWDLGSNRESDEDYYAE